MLGLAPESIEEWKDDIRVRIIARSYRVFLNPPFQVPKYYPFTPFIYNILFYSEAWKGCEFHKTCLTDQLGQKH